MIVKWLVEKYDEDVEKLLQSLEKSKIKFELLPSSLCYLSKYDYFKDDECVVFYGSLEAARQVQRLTKWIPGVYGNFNNFKCSKYFSYLGKYLLNSDYAMLPMMEFSRRREEIYNKYGVNGNVFIRPNSGLKTFNGFILNYDKIDEEFKFLRTYAKRDLDDIIAVVSSFKSIEVEWRMVVVDREVISSSRYMLRGEENYRSGGEEGAISFAKKIAEGVWQPDFAYTIDICRSGGNYYLLEANSFSCSGLYLCSLEAVVKAVSDAALKEWKEYNEVML
jgi:hypothetical protein